MFALARAPFQLNISLILLLVVYACLLAVDAYVSALPFDVASVELLFFVIAIAVSIWCYLSREKLAEKLFYSVIASALTFFLLVKSAQVLFAQYVASQLIDFGYFFSYLLVVLALRVRPEQSLLDEELFSVASTKNLAMLFFLLAGFIYLVLIPHQLAGINTPVRLTATGFLPVVHVVMLLMLVHNMGKASSSHWRLRYFIFAVAALILLIEEALAWSLVRYNHDYWHVNASALLESVALVLISLSFIATSNKDTLVEFKPLIINRLHWFWFVALSLPLFHFAGYGFNWFNADFSSAREMLLFVWCLAFAILYQAETLAHKHRRQKLLSKVDQLEYEKIGLRHQLDNLHQASRFMALSDQLPFAILVISEKGLVQYANHNASSLLALGDEVAQLSDFLTPPQTVDNLLSQYRYHQMSHHQDKAFQVDIVLNRGSLPGHNMRISMQKLEDKEQSIYLLALLDVEEYKQAEQQALKIKDKFIANISHEFRTPLTIIGGVLYEERLARQAGEREQLEVAQRNVDKLVSMVDQLLELSQLAHVKMKKPTAQNVSLQLQEIVSHFVPLAKQQGLVFGYQISPTLWANVSGTALDKIASNLLANAFKYGGSNGQVTLELWLDGDKIVLAVSDNGVGMSALQQKQIFERYYQAKNGSHSETYGVGIGLSLVCELIAAHQWQLNIDSSPGQGSCFKITMPVTEAIETPIAEKPDEEESLVIEAISSQAQVLVIEDNLEMQAYIHRVLGKHYNCVLADTGNDGVTLAQQNVPDLIVCDLMLPDIDGFKVLDQLRESHITGHIPVVMLTARNDMASKLEGLNRRADDYLTKPFNQEELVVRINNLLLSRQRLQQHFLGQIDQPANAEMVPEAQVESTMSAQAQKLIDKLNDILANQYTNEQFDIGELSSAMAMSERQLQRKVKAVVNLTPKEYLREYRLNKARQMLIEHHQIGSVALSCGFSSQTYFTRCFKEKYKMTPSDFVKSLST